MPFSHNRFDAIIAYFIAHSRYHSWLDIGAGSGKYAKIIRQNVTDAEITGVEIEQDYIVKYQLDVRYDKILHMDASKLLALPGSWEGVIIGDVIEHLPKSQGIDLIHYLVYRCKSIIIVYPKGRIQDTWNGYESEKHISVWGVPDWQYFDYRIWEHPASDLVIVDGYIAHEDVPLAEDIKVYDST
jgi:hypothetical protein